MNALQGVVTCERGREALFLKVLTKEKRRGWKWTKDLLVSNIGQSIDYMILMKEVCPTVKPCGPYLVFRDGKVFVASARLVLALQGVSNPEACYYRLTKNEVTESLLHNFAGNGFNCNVMVAAIIAVLVGSA